MAPWNDVDVVVIGGGTGGSAAAGLPARQGTLIGDSALFVDPLLSTGAGLTPRGALGVGEPADVAPHNPADENVLHQFVRFRYDRTRSKEDYRSAAQDDVDPRLPRPREIDFVRVLSGGSGMRDR